MGTKKQKESLDKTYRSIFGPPPTKKEADRIRRLLKKRRGRKKK